MLGDQHVKNSPLRLSVTDIKTKETGSKVLEETEKVSTWLQKLHLPSETPTDPVGEEGSDVTKDQRQSGSKFDVKSDATNTPGDTKFPKRSLKTWGRFLWPFSSIESLFQKCSVLKMEKERGS